MNRIALMNSIKIMLFVMLLGTILFLLCSGGGRLVILFNFLLKPFIWICTLPMIGPFIFILTGLILYAIFVKSPSPEWKRNEKYVFISTLLITAGGWLTSTEHAGTIFLMTCIIGVSYPIIQIVRYEAKGVRFIQDILK